MFSGSPSPLRNKCGLDSVRRVWNGERRTLPEVTGMELGTLEPKNAGEPSENKGLRLAC